MRRFLICGCVVILAAFQLGISGPAETMRRAEAGKNIKPKIIKTQGGLEVEWLDIALTVEQLPIALRRLLETENTNSLYADPTVFGERRIDLSILGPYEPIKGNIFYIPYIPMPISDLKEFYRGVNFTEELKKTLLFKHDGETYVRVLINPSRTSSYDALIAKYGIVRDELVGFAGASHRSFYIFDPNDRSMPIFQAKTSQHFKVANDLKLNGPHKLARAALVNNLMAEIPEEAKRRLGFDFIPESLAVLPVGAGTIVRDIPEKLYRSNHGKRWVPGFTLTAESEADVPLLARALSGSRDRVRDAAELLRPLIRDMIYLSTVEGLKGEPHEQNNYHELDAEGRPTGRILMKDLDSFRVDVELRIRQGKSVDAMRDIFKPFVYGKFSQASGWSGIEKGNNDGYFDQGAYDYFVKHSYGYSFCQVLKCTDKQQERFWALLDQIYAEEFHAQTGIRAEPPSDSASVKTDWISKVIGEYRDQLNSRLYFHDIPNEQKTVAVQKVLASEFDRLRKLKRVSAILGDLDHPNVYFIRHGAIIEARERYGRDGLYDKAIGFVAMERESAKSSEQFEAAWTLALKKVSLIWEPARAGKLKFACGGIFKLISN